MTKKTVLEKRVEQLELDFRELRAKPQKRSFIFNFVVGIFYIILWIVLIVCVFNFGFYFVEGMFFHEQLSVYFTAKPNIQNLVDSPWAIDGLEVMTMKRVGGSYIIYGYLGHENSGKTYPLTFVVDANGDILNRDGLDVVLEFFGAIEVQEDDSKYLIPQAEVCHETDEGLWVGCDNNFVKEKVDIPVQ